MSGRKKTKKVQEIIDLAKPEQEEQILDQVVLEQSTQYEKRIYDLEQLLDIAKSFCSTLDFSKLLESIKYMCMAQMHVLGAEIFVRDLVTNEVFTLGTSMATMEESNLDPMINAPEELVTIPVNSPITNKLLELKKPVTFAELSSTLKNCPHLQILESFNPTLIVPLIEKNHLNGMLILQERIAIEEDTSYTEYEQNMIMSIASLASVAINNASLMEMSSTDMMTHLKLKYYFFNVLSDEIDSAFLNNEEIAVLMFDIDHFKIFNDTYGHECGDYVLISVANLIKRNIRESDVASRYGGEEFTVLLRNTSKEDALEVAERIRKAIENEVFVYKNQQLHVTISIGVSVFNAEKNLVESPNVFVNQADQALYVSKESGRNKVSLFETAS